MPTTAQYQCGGRRLLIAREDQALEVSFVRERDAETGQLRPPRPQVVLLRRCVGSPIGETELGMLSDLVLQWSSWLWRTL